MLFPLVGRMAADRPVAWRLSAGGDLLRRCSAFSLASRYLLRIQPIGPLDSSRPLSLSWPPAPSYAEYPWSELSPVKLFRGLFTELPMDVALTSALSFTPRVIRGEVIPGGELPASSFLVLESLHRFFFSFSAVSVVVVLAISSS